MFDQVCVCLREEKRDRQEARKKKTVIVRREQKDVRDGFLREARGGSSGTRTVVDPAAR